MPKISALPAVGTTPLNNADLLVCVQGGVTCQATVADLPGSGGAGPGPHWVTPVADYLEWLSGSTFVGQVKLDYSGVFTFTAQNGSTMIWQDTNTNSVTEVFGGGVYSIILANNYVWNVTVTAGGQLAISHAANSWTVSGFATTSTQITGLTAGYWGGPGTPATVENAIERIAAVVSAGGGTPIP